MNTTTKDNPLHIPFPMVMGLVAGLLWLLAIGWLGYVANQSNFYAILGGYAVAFGAYGWLIGMSRDAVPERFMKVLSIAGRLLFFGAVPLLSDDLFRFLWDGLRWLDGSNAYLRTPTEVITLFARDPSYAKLYPLLNSPDYFSIYPPVLQILFVPAAWIWRTTGSLVQAAVVLRCFMLFGDLLAWTGMQQLRIPNARRFWYFLNPLVVVEVFGNLHAEGLMVGLLSLSTGWLLANRTQWSGLAFAASVNTKLITALFGPLFLFTQKRDHRWPWIIAAVGLSLVLSWPILNTLWQGGFVSSLDLYFRKFEFNAGLYYLLRAIGWQLAGFNPIAYLGPFLAVLGAVIVVIIALRRRKRNIKQLGEAMLWSLMAYLLTATTVHPWYLITLVFLGTLTARRFTLAWSFLVVLSYSHYYHGDFHERYGWIAVEYGLLLVALISTYWGKAKS